MRLWAGGRSQSLNASIGTLRQAFAAAGTYSISVQYGGDTNYQSVTSNTVQVVGW
jgi:hypothetical protein